MTAPISSRSVPIFPADAQALSIPGSAKTDSSSFKNILLDSIQQVNSMQLDANKAVEGLFTGDDVNPAEVLTAVQKADLAFRTMMQVRNKLIQAYQEVKDIRI